MSACAGSVGKPVEGPPRCTSTKTHRRLSHGGVANVLHHQREARPGGHGESFRTAPDRALKRDGGSQFVFHLNKRSADGRNAIGEAFDHLGGRGDGIAGRKPRSGSQCSLATGVVAVEKVRARHHSCGISVHLAPPVSPPQPQCWRSAGAPNPWSLRQRRKDRLRKSPPPAT